MSEARMSEAHRVLVVDDDLEIVQAACLRLRAAGYEAWEATDGEAALAAAVERRPDLILLDVRMPHKDGLAVLSELKHRPDTSQIPVVMLSASVVDQSAGLDGGARFFIRKPYNGATLVQAVRTALETPANSDPARVDATSFEEHGDAKQTNSGGR